MANKHILYSQAQEWITTFTSLGSLCQGYQKERVTPYMHIMAYHVPRLMMLHKGIKKFSGQGTYVNYLKVVKMKTSSPNHVLSGISLPLSVKLTICTVWLTDHWNLKLHKF